jgi:transcriptional regulator PpsR
MDAQTTTPETVPFRSPGTSLAALTHELAGHLIAASGDVALVVGPDGIIQDLAIGSADLAADGAEAWLGQSWAATVANDSRNKVAEMLAGDSGRPPRWRQVNQLVGTGEVPVRYLAFETGGEGAIIAIGRDMRATAVLQQRLIAAQQAVERERLKGRQAESRYRLLFGLSTEAVVIVDGSTRTVIEANPAAERLLGKPALAGRSLPSLFAPQDRESLLATLGAIAASDESPPARLHAAETGDAFDVGGTLFRQGGASFILLRLGTAGGSGPDLETILERVPDAFVLTDGGFVIREANGRFIELVGHARRDDVVGHALTRFIGRPGIDSTLMVTEIEAHGAFTALSTIARTRFGDQVEVEVSGVATADWSGDWRGFAIRPAHGDRRALVTQLASPRSVEELTDLVGRMSLKDIVRESTDLIERLCIEAALKCADNNRASAAEILGLSRQGLYLKLHRHGLARDTSEDKPGH